MRVISFKFIIHHILVRVDLKYVYTVIFLNIRYITYIINLSEFDTDKSNISESKHRFATIN